MIKIKKGDTFHFQRRKYHVVRIIRDRGIRIIVTRFFGKYKQWWHYEVFDEWSINNMIEMKLTSINN